MASAWAWRLIRLFASYSSVRNVIPRASLTVQSRLLASYVYSVTPSAGWVTFHSRGVVLVGHGSAGVVGGLRDPVRCVVCERQPPPVGGRDLDHLAIRAVVLAPDGDGVPVAVTDRPERGIVGEHVNRPVAQAQVPAVAVPGDPRLVERVGCSRGLEDCVSPSCPRRRADIVDPSAVGQDEIHLLVLVGRPEEDPVVPVGALAEGSGGRVALAVRALTLIGRVSGRTRSVLVTTPSPVARSTGSPSVASPLGAQDGGRRPDPLNIAPVKAQMRVPGSGTTWLPSAVTVPLPYVCQPRSSGS